MKLKAAVVMPFADFWEPLTWKGHPALRIIDKHLRTNGVESTIIDINEEFQRNILKNIRIEDYESDEPRKASFVHFLKKCPEKTISNKEFYTELIEPFSDFGKKEYEEDCITSMKDAEKMMSSPKGKRLSDVTADILKNEGFMRELFFVTIPTKVHIVSAMMIGELLKKHYPECHVCFGGPYITMSGDGEWLVSNGYCDTFVSGPGENKITELLGKLEEKPKGEIKAGEREMDINLQINDSPGDEEFTKVVLSRGCIWNKCTFCDYRQLNTSFAIKRLDVLMNELEILINRHGKDNFLLLTDTIPPAYARELSESIIKKGWDITWSPRYIKVDKGFDEELFMLMKKSGCKLNLTSIGIDSVSEMALKYANKGYTREDIVRFLGELERSGMAISQINLIYDLPGTSFEDGLDSVDILESLINTYDNLSAHKFQLTATSEMGRNPEKYGLRLVKRTKSERLVLYCNNLDFIDENGLKMDQRKILNNTYYHIQTSLKGCRLYKNLDRRDYNSIKLYKPEKTVLEVKIPDRLEKISTSEGVIYIHADRLADGLIMDSQYFLSKVKPGKWYSVENLASFEDESDQRIMFITLQKTFRYVRGLLARGYFSDARLCKKVEMHRGVIHV